MNTKILAEETLQQLWAAGYESAYPDNGFAFDRAVLALEASTEVFNWTQTDWDEFEQQLAALRGKE